VRPLDADLLSMRGPCRYCGAVSHQRTVVGFVVCDDCANSPLCDECGHPRSDHGQVFVRGVRAGCRFRAFDVQSLSRLPCECTGFRPMRGALGDAEFALPDADPLELGLRVVVPPP
jgi:hypothetical protein